MDDQDDNFIRQSSFQDSDTSIDTEVARHYADNLMNFTIECDSLDPTPQGKKLKVDANSHHWINNPGVSDISDEELISSCEAMEGKHAVLSERFG